MAGCFKVIQLAILVFLFLPCIVQVLTRKSNKKKPKPSIEDSIERFVKEVSKCKYIPGLTLAVVKDDRVLMTKGFGQKDWKTKGKVDERTLFGIAGLTKAFTAATLVKILPKNNITLTTPLNEFLNITFPTEQLNAYVTLEDLLSHRTGLIENNYLRLNPNFTRKTQHKFLEHFDIRQDFRTDFAYNNVLYGLASSITEHLTNTTWENAVRTQLLRPLGMRKTTFSTTDNVDNLNIAQPYLHSGGSRRISHDFLKRWGELGGSGAMLTNALDMTRWMRFLLNGGELDGEQIMDSTSLKDMFKARNQPGSRSTFMRPNIPITISDDLYCLGLRKGYYRGFPIITHTGSTWGYKSMLTLFPGQTLGIFTAQTGSDSKYIKRHLLHSYIADIYLGEQPWLNHTSACFPWKSSKRNKRKTLMKRREALLYPMAKIRYDHFFGIYSNKLWGNLRFEKAIYGMRMVYGYASFRIKPTSNPLVFKADGRGEHWFIELSSVEFETETKNKKRVVSVRVPSFERRMPPTFYKVKQ